jgi:hypothetical protein
MDQTYTSMMSGIPAALAIWLGLIGASGAAFAVLAALAGRARRRTNDSLGPGGTTPVAAGYVPRNEAMLRALAAAKAVTDEEPAPGAARRTALRLSPAKLSRPRLSGPRFARPNTARPNTARPNTARSETTRPETARPETAAPTPREPEAAATDVLETVEVSDSTEVFEVVGLSEAPGNTGAVEAADESRSDDERFADELATAAARAGVSADKRQAEWEAAQRAVDTAWQAYEDAEAAAKRAVRAAAFPVPETPLTPSEYADRERYLHRAAQAAQARGDFSTDQLIDALSHRNGFDPRLHPFEQDALLRRLARDEKLRVYQKMAAAERAAWREAELASAARRSLDREAEAAARNVAPQPQPVDASRRISVRVPVLSLR